MTCLCILLSGKIFDTTVGKPFTTTTSLTSLVLLQAAILVDREEKKRAWVLVITAGQEAVGSMYCTRKKMAGQMAGVLRQVKVSFDFTRKRFFHGKCNR